MPDTMLLDMLICDTLIRDMVSKGKWSIVGIIENIQGPEFPLGLARLNVYTRIANAPKQGVFGLTVTSPGGLVIQAKQFPFEGIDARFSFEVGTFISGVMFSQPGRYSVQVSIDDQVLGERAFYAQKVEVVAKEEE